MTKILISGGAGFIGNHVARRALGAGYSVRILDNLSEQVHGPRARFHGPDAAEFIRGDVTCREDWQRALEDVDAVVHLAAETGTGQSMYEIGRYYSVNVQGTALLFDLLANERHRVSNIVLASSRSVYGEGAYICRGCDPAGVRRYPEARSKEQLEAHDWCPKCPQCGAAAEATATREGDRLAPASIYAATKLAQEDLVRVACSALAIPHSILRFQNVFGEGQSLKNPYTGILSIFSTRIRLGLPVEIFEDGEETRDFVNVADVADAVLACIGQGPSEGGATMNIGSGSPTSVLEVARLLARVMGSASEPTVSGAYRVGDIRHNYADISRAKERIGFQPKVDIKTGLERFADWVRTQPVPQDLLDEANRELKSRKLMG